MSSDVIVVGGGVAGLVAARRLALAGRNVVLLERADRLGGQVQPLPLAGVMLDAAAESFATRGGAVAALAGELGLEVVSPTPAPAWLHRADGTAVPLPVAGVLGIPGTPLAHDVVRAIGRFGAWRAALDRALPARIGRDAASLGALVRARMGSRVVDGLVAPVVRGVHSKEPDALPVDAVSPRLRAELAARGSLAAAVQALRAQAPAGTQVGGLHGGMHRLVTALAADADRLGIDVRTGVDVTALDARGVVVDGERLGGTVVRAFSAPGQRRRLTLVTLVVDAPAWDAAPRGTGLLVAADAPGVGARALTHITAKWRWAADALGARHAVRLSYDGDLAGDAVARAVADAQKLLGAPVQTVTDAAVQAWERGVQPYRDDIVSVGEGVAGTGLAGVVAHAERTAAAMTTST